MKLVVRAEVEGVSAEAPVGAADAHGDAKVEVTSKIAQRLIDEGINGNVTQMAYPPYRRIPDFDIPTNVYVMVAENGPWSLAAPEKLAADTPLGPVASPPSARDIWTRIYSPAERARLAVMLASARSKVGPLSVEARRIDLMKREFFDGLDKSAKEWELMAETVARDVYDASLGKPMLLENLTRRKDTNKPGVRTEVRMSKTANSFVVDWDCEESDMANTLCADRKDGDIDMWRDNGVEFRINPSNDGRVYYQFILTERGALFSSKLFLDGSRDKRDQNWSSDAKRFVEKTSRGWKARLEIPLASMPWFTDTFRGNFCRNRVRRSGEEFIISSRYATGYGNYERFGTVKLK